MKDTLKEMIDIEALELYYRALMPKEENGKRYISVSTMEKIMLLEIYKTLCTGSHDNINNSNHSSKD